MSGNKRNGAATRRGSKSTEGRGTRSSTRGKRGSANVVESDGGDGSDEGDGRQERQFGEREEHSSLQGDDSHEPDPNTREELQEMDAADIAGSVFMGVGSAVVLKPHEEAQTAMVKVARQPSLPQDAQDYVAQFYVLVHKSGDLPPQAGPRSTDELLTALRAHSCRATSTTRSGGTRTGRTGWCSLPLLNGRWQSRPPRRARCR